MKAYPKYKDSDIDFIGSIPEHWNVKKVGHFLDFSRGLPITKQNLKDQGVPCVNYGEIHSKFGFSVNPEINFLRCVDESYLETSEQSLLKRGDFVFADTSEDIEGSGNFTCLDSDIPTFAGYHTIIIRHKNIDYKFLAFYFDSLEYRNQIRSEVYGIKVFSITQAILKKSSFILPPKTEQKAIANYLDRKTAELDHLITEKKALVKLYEEEKTAVINQAVTKGINNATLKDSSIEWLKDIPEHWIVKKLKYVANVQTGRTPKISGSKIDYFKNGNINWYTPGDFTKGEYLTNSKRTLIKEAFEKNQVELFKENSTYLVSIGATLGKVSMALNKASANQQINVISFLDEKINPFYGYLFILGNSEMILNEADYTTLPILNQTKLNNIFIAVPPITEQTEIVEYIEQDSKRIDAKIKKAKKYIKLLTEYRTSIISEVVTGKLKVID